MANSVAPGQTAFDIDKVGQKLDIQPRHLIISVLF